MASHGDSAGQLGVHPYPPPSGADSPPGLCFDAPESAPPLAGRVTILWLQGPCLVGSGVGSLPERPPGGGTCRRGCPLDGRWRAAAALAEDGATLPGRGLRGASPEAMSTPQDCWERHGCRNRKASHSGPGILRAPEVSWQLCSGDGHPRLASTPSQNWGPAGPLGTCLPFCGGHDPGPEGQQGQG